MEPASSPDHYLSALRCLAVCARLRGIPVDPEQLLHANPAGADLEQDLIRAAIRLGFKARVVNGDVEDLARLPLPIPALERSGSWCVVAGMEQEVVLLWSPAEGSQRIAVSEFASRWSARAVSAGVITS